MSTNFNPWVIAGILAVIIIILKLIPNSLHAKIIGKKGEDLIEHELDRAYARGNAGVVLRNVYVPAGNGRTTEIDLLYITVKGMFVLESKNYSGWVFGNEDDQYWTVTLKSKQKNRIYNPIKQNAGHIKHLREYLRRPIPMFSVVVFSERCELKNITLTSHQAIVAKRNRLTETINDIWKSYPDVLTEAEVEEIYYSLYALTNASFATKKKHVDEINRRYK